MLIIGSVYLSEGGDPKAQQCGCLKNKFGLSGQVVPRIVEEMMTHPDPAQSQRVFAAMMQMKKIDIQRLQQAFAG